jgi:hypothetical protein
MATLLWVGMIDSTDALPFSSRREALSFPQCPNHDINLTSWARVTEHFCWVDGREVL